MIFKWKTSVIVSLFSVGCFHWSTLILSTEERKSCKKTPKWQKGLPASTWQHKAIIFSILALSKNVNTSVITMWFFAKYGILKATDSIMKADEGGSNRCTLWNHRSRLWIPYLDMFKFCSIYTTDHSAEGKQFISICWRTKERVEQQAAYQEEGFLNFDVCAPIHQPVSLTLSVVWRHVAGLGKQAKLNSNSFPGGTRRVKSNKM